MEKTSIDAINRLSNHPDFKVFIEFLRTVKTAEIEKMVKEVQVDNIKIAQGKIRILDAILTIIGDNVTPVSKNKQSVDGGV